MIGRDKEVCLLVVLIVGVLVWTLLCGGWMMWENRKLDRMVQELDR